MVRAHVKQPTDEKKDTTKKRTGKKRNSETGVWPCKINGCNKEFAREADLKRHQRTTKLHSSPGFSVSCPQCDASFTRTDALRRHQKSRHNGVVIEPADPSRGAKWGDKTQKAESSSATQSRSGTPNKDAKACSDPNADAMVITVPVPTVLVRPDTAGPGSGPQSYYRQHTVNPVFVPPRTPHGVLDSSNFQPGTQLPTSATRTQNAVWPPAPPWVSDQQKNPMGPVPVYAQYYAPGSYYRTPTGQPMSGPLPGPPGTGILIAPQPGLSPSHQQANGQTNATTSNNIDPSLASNSATKGDGNDADKTLDNTPINDAASINAAVQKALQAVLAIDPSLSNIAAAVQQQAPSGGLESSSDGDKQTAPTVDETALISQLAAALTRTNAAAAAAAKAAASSTNQENTSDMTRSAGADIKEKERETELDADADGEVDPDNSAMQEVQNDQALEEGMSMLRPDELLNEESLSSFLSTS